MSEEILYVYGTLREGDAKTIKIPGVLHDMGWFPAALRIGNSDKFFLAERRVISSERLKQFDRYEGYNEDEPDKSFYKRIKYLDGWIYQFNKDVEDAPLVECGDWLDYVKEGKARYA